MRRLNRAMVERVRMFVDLQGDRRRAGKGGNVGIVPPAPPAKGRPPQGGTAVVPSPTARAKGWFPAFVPSEGQVHDFPPTPSSFTTPRVPCDYCGREAQRGEQCRGCGAVVVDARPPKPAPPALRIMTDGRWADLILPLVAAIGALLMQMGLI